MSLATSSTLRGTQARLRQPGSVLFRPVEMVGKGKAGEVLLPRRAFDKIVGQVQDPGSVSPSTALNEKATARHQALPDGFQDGQMIFYPVQTGKGDHQVEFLRKVQL